VIDTAARAADTTKALRGLGFSKDEVATAVNAARTHVGDAAATVEQWVMTALRFCPRPIVSS
jgi:Holliday junction resolvasome RuvABC DNA-binding subunit